MLGDPLNFKTVKDRIIFGAIRDAYKVAADADKITTASAVSADTIEQIRGHLQALGSIREKRSQQYFKLVSTDETLVQKITQAYLTATNHEVKQQSRTEMQIETNDLINLILADYQLHVN